jgi:hypothetical protein
MSTENKQKRPKYTLEFKKDAAKLVIEKDYTQEQAANNHPNLLPIMFGSFFAYHRFLLGSRQIGN